VSALRFVVSACVALAACSGAPSPPLSALPSGSPAQVLAVCDKEPYPQLAIGCRVEAAAQAADAGDIDTITAACAAVPEGRWRDECHFRAGEQLGKAGRTDDALSQCAGAGGFGRFCLTHAGWGLPPTDERTPEELAQLARRQIPGELGEQAAGVLRSRAWFNRFVGTGTADPAVARAASGDDVPPAHTAWAIEAVRLSGGFDAAEASWAAGTVLSGPVLAVGDRVGRYDTFPDFPGEESLPRVLTFADAARFVGETPEEDVDIALIEAVYFNLQTGPEAGAAFSRWLDDPRKRVRYTALRRFRSLPSTGVEARLQALTTDPDPIIQAHAVDGLKYKTWLGKQR
jgi:hypothetical protein